MIKHVKNSHAIKFHLPDNMPHVIPNVVFGPTTRLATSLNQDSPSALTNLPFIPPPPGTNTVATQQTTTVAANCYKGSKLLQRPQTATVAANCYSDSKLLQWQQTATAAAN